MIKKYFLRFLLLACYKITLASIPPSVMHGAQIFQQYCAACHSIKYLEGSKNIPSFPIKETPAILGIHPPDLSLEVSARGKHWVYEYLNGFYPDPKSPTGMNNKVYPGTVMPNILAGLKNQLSPIEFHKTLTDLESFLSYASDPHQETRKYLGYWVVGFLIILALLFFLLFRIIRRDENTRI